MLIRINLLWVSNTDFCSVNTVLDFVCEFSPWKGSKLDLKSEYLPYLGRVNMVKSKYTQNLHKIFLKVGLKSWYQSANKPFLYLLFLFLWTSVSFHFCLLLHFIHQYLTLSSSIYLYLLLSYLLSTLIYFDLLLCLPPFTFISILFFLISSTFFYLFMPLLLDTHVYVPHSTPPSVSMRLSSNFQAAFDLNPEWAFSSQAFPFIHLFTIELWCPFVRIRRECWIIYGWI